MPSQAGEESDLSVCVCVWPIVIQAFPKKGSIGCCWRVSLSLYYFEYRWTKRSEISSLSKPWARSWTGRANMFSRRAHLDKYQMVIVWIVLRTCLL